MDLMTIGFALWNSQNSSSGIITFYFRKKEGEEVTLNLRVKVEIGSSLL